MSWISRQPGAGWLWPTAVLLLSTTATAVAQTVYIREYAVPPVSGSSLKPRPAGITAGPDGALWFADTQNAVIGRITPSGAITTYPTTEVPGNSITVGPDGALWFVELRCCMRGAIARITTSGVLAEYPVTGEPDSIAAGPDGALWFTIPYSTYSSVSGYGGSAIGRITPGGAITWYHLPDQAYPTGITAGPDGALWFRENGGIGRIATNGTILSYPAPALQNAYWLAGTSITAGPDGALWFAEPNGVGRITTAGIVTEFPVTAGCVSGIAAGSDRALWYTGCQNRLGRITTSGSVTEYAVPTAGSNPLGITAGPDGAIWFTENWAAQIGQAVVGSPDTSKPVSHVLLLPPTEPSTTFTVEWSGTDSGSGIRDFNIYVSTNGGPYAEWLHEARGTQATFVGLLGNTYSFYSVARDLAGNQEDPKVAAEAVTQPSGILSDAFNIGFLSYLLPPDTGPYAIAAAPDGTLWFIAETVLGSGLTWSDRRVGRISTSGVTVQYSIPDDLLHLTSIAVSQDGAAWVTANDSYNGSDWAAKVGKIARITSAGDITAYTVPVSPSAPHQIVAGPDGALWFTDYQAGMVGRMSTTGRFSLYPLPPGYKPKAITVGPDGALWFTEIGSLSKVRVGRITTAGVMTHFDAGTDTVGGAFSLNGIAAGPDGAIWFTGNGIGRITTAGVFSQFPVPVGTVIPSGQLYGITAGPDGALWFPIIGYDYYGYKPSTIGRITTTGVVTIYDLTDHLRTAFQLTLGPDNALWVTSEDKSQTTVSQTNVNSITQVIVGPLERNPPISRVSQLNPSQSSANFKVQWSGTDSESGVRDFTIYFSDESGPFTAWLTRTTAREATFSGVAGHRYGFYSIARDFAGNLELSKGSPDALTQVASTVAGDLNGDGRVDCADLALVQASLGKRSGQAGFDPRADLNQDGVVDIRDISAESQLLSPDIRCQ